MPKIPVKRKQLTPRWTTADGETVRLYLGDVLETLREMPSRSIHCVVTSPPYWALRDYGTAIWKGGDKDCAHEGKRTDNRRAPRARTPQAVIGYNGCFADRLERAGGDNASQGYLCLKCGARRVDKQIGSEPSPDCGTQGAAQCGQCFICAMVAVFREVRRVLRDDGTLWLNLGDSYSGSGKGQNADGTHNSKAGDKQHTNKGATVGGLRTDSSLPSGNLVGIPWRVALALQADGWVLRQDIVWYKLSPMPESVRNRCTKSHEYVFLLTKSMRYYYDAEAIKERSKTENAGDAISYNGRKNREARNLGKSLLGSNEHQDAGPHISSGKTNKRSVWGVASQGYPGAHFATFPPKLIEPMILAGTSARGCCAKCGSPWKRVVRPDEATAEAQAEARNGQDWYARAWDNSDKRRTAKSGDKRRVLKTGDKAEGGYTSRYETIGWVPTCECYGKLVKESESAGDGVARTTLNYVSSLPLKDHPVKPCIVLDPFMGSGTVAAVSVSKGRHSWGIELSEEYLVNHQIARVEQALRNRPYGYRLIPEGEETPKIVHKPEAIDF